ncbi:MAG TPA: phospholipid carrier-dependent glycosyltransferase [Candidatus Polarisedimenticolaceae bacterium]|nr:phospholipid carrier-dependent glycosyltransferase [Candidatus Polarisedimenticolaceae bacterium]
MTRARQLLLTDLAPGLLFLFAVLCFAPRLSVPQQYVFDEVYHAYTAGQYVAGNADAYVWSTTAPREGVAYMWNHPPLGILLIATGILTWGDVAFGWRFMSVIFGAAGIVLAFVLALRVTKDRTVALLAAGLLLAEGLYFAQARVGMLDVFGVFFAMGALLSLHGFLTGEMERAAWPIVRTGLWLGAALATKWNAAYLAACCGLVVLWKVRRVPRLWPWAVVGLGVVPFLVYLAAYIPFFAVGHTASEWVELQKQIYLYHTRLTATHPWSSSWWQWPLALRPVWYWTNQVGDRFQNGFAAQNIILTWSFLPAVAWLVWRWRRSHAALTVLLIGFFGQWLPWAAVARIAFTYHFLPSVPFGVLAVAVAVATAHRRGGRARAIAWAYVAIVVATFVFYYPILTGIPLSKQALAWRLWLPGWVPR